MEFKVVKTGFCNLTNGMARQELVENQIDMPKSLIIIPQVLDWKNIDQSGKT